MAKDKPYLEAEKKIQQALKSGATELDLQSMRLTELPESIGQLTQLTELNLSNNQLTALPDSLGQLTQLRELDLFYNQLAALPDWLGGLTQLRELDLAHNQLTTLPDFLGQLLELQKLDVGLNQLTVLPESIKQLTQLHYLNIMSNSLIELPNWLGDLLHLRELYIAHNHLGKLPECLHRLTNLELLQALHTGITKIPDWIGNFPKLYSLRIGEDPILKFPETISKLPLKELGLGGASGHTKLNNLPVWIRSIQHLEELQLIDCNLSVLPDWIGDLTKLNKISLQNNKLHNIPSSIAQLEHLEELDLSDNPLNPALQSAYDACKPPNYEPLFAYLRSLEQNAEPLYESKLVLVGEGNVGKTTLLKALKGGKGKRAPKKNEATTHGVEIDIRALHLPHPTKKKVKIQLNAWDFGGQDVYRVTHQFFFSRRSLYLLVWEPRRGVQQGQVEDWLNMIRLRVGTDARVIIISTYCKTGNRIARINKPDLEREYGEMIVGFHEVDSLVPDETTGEMVGIAELKKVIAAESAKLPQMGMGFNRDWKAARDELLAHSEPRISSLTFSGVCAAHGLSQLDAETLAHLMHDLGYIVHYADDEKLRDDVVLKPEWLTKAIGFVLENRATAEREGILPDDQLYKVWHDHTFPDEPRYTTDLYPFFLRLMEKYDVSYRLPEGDASLVAQHVPQVRPDLPWLPEDKQPNNLRRIAIVCSMEEDPPGLVPWMIVRTHDYAVEQGAHHLHWQKGMFLSHPPHGEAMLEKRGREFHVYAQADWPEYFMNVLQHTLQKLIDDNWPGLKDRYRFMVPCPETIDGQPCKGRFNIHALRQWLGRRRHDRALSGMFQKTLHCRIVVWL